MDTQISERDKKIKISVGTLNKFNRTNRHATFFYIL